MKKRSILTKGVSLLASAALLLSCLVLSVPVAGAVAGPSATFGNTVPSTTAPTANNQGKYRVRLCVHEDDGFDKSLHDNVDYVAGITYGVNNSKRNLNGTSTGDDNGNYWCEYAKISYKDMNGTGTAGAVWFNLGDRDAHGRTDVISSGGQDYAYFPSDDGLVISGFPTSFTTRYYEKANGSGGYTVYLQVAVWTSASTWEWTEGTCTGTGFLGIGGWDSNNAGGVFSGSTGSISTSGGGTQLPLSVSLSDDSKYPAAQTAAPACSYAVTRLTCPATAQSSAVSSQLQFSSLTDQYGAVMAASITTDCEYSAQGISQSGKTTTVKYAANLLEDANAQVLTATVTWPQKVKSGQRSGKAELEIYDAVYEVLWKNDAGEIVFNENYSYGDVPGANVPAKQADNCHYLNPTWDHAYEPVTDLSNNIYQASYTPAEHHYVECYAVDATYHRFRCDTDAENIHYDTFEHSMKEKVVEPTCTQEGYTRHYCEFCNYEYDTDRQPALSHKWNAGVITTEPACGVSGEKTFTCSRCGETKTQIVSALEHSPVLQAVAPSDKHDGGVYYMCENCGCYWGAVYSQTMQNYDIPNETPLENIEDALTASDALPAPHFNIYNDEMQSYDYSTRGASLKLVQLKTPDYQPLRFTASVRVPAGVSAAVGSEGNAVKDVGIVYSQTRLIESTDAFCIGADNVYRMSLKDKNGDAVYDGTNWNGISSHDASDGTHLTFNIVVNVKCSNWQEAYCARAYVTYNYNGFEYTVYDEAFSTRSVQDLAQSIVNNPEESPEMRAYCQSVILDNIV